jgi:hypothetical protein
LVHLHLNLPNPIVGCQQLQSVIQGIKRGKGARASYKLPFSPNDLLLIKSVLDLADIADACLFGIVTVCFFGLIRIGNVTVSNNNWANCVIRSDLSFLGNGAVIMIRASKTIQCRERIHKAVLPNFAGHDLSPVAALKHFLSIAGSVPPCAPLFAYMSGGRLVIPLASVVRRRLQCVMKSVGLDCSEFSTHSLRRGGATWLLSTGVPVQTIKVLGDWKSDSVFKYLTPSPSQRLSMFPHNLS